MLTTDGSGCCMSQWNNHSRSAAAVAAAVLMLLTRRQTRSNGQSSGQLAATDHRGRPGEDAARARPAPASANWKEMRSGSWCFPCRRRRTMTALGRVEMARTCAAAETELKGRPVGKWRSSAVVLMACLAGWATEMLVSDQFRLVLLQIERSVNNFQRKWRLT